MLNLLKIWMFKLIAGKEETLLAIINKANINLQLKPIYLVYNLMYITIQIN